MECGWRETNLFFQMQDLSNRLRFFGTGWNCWIFEEIPSSLASGKDSVFWSETVNDGVATLAVLVADRLVMDSESA